AAAAGVADASTETTTVRLTGMGEGARFYIGGVAVEGVGYSADAGGTYTITGLTQAQLGQLGFRQINAELSDQDAGTAGIQIGVQAWTVESADPDNPSDPVSATITLNLQAQRTTGTAGDDWFFWTGGTIDGGGGNDVVALAAGQDLTGAELALSLDSIEELDLTVPGANSIEELTPEQARQILGVEGTLVITGTAEDSVTLGDGWTLGGTTGDYTIFSSGEGATLHVSSAMLDDAAGLDGGALRAAGMAGPGGWSPLELVPPPTPAQALDE